MAKRRRAQLEEGRQRNHYLSAILGLEAVTCREFVERLNYFPWIVNATHYGSVPPRYRYPGALPKHRRVVGLEVPVLQTPT